ncbi:MAG TPA: carboxypeptidase-like regulatory domain-containing protein, partial [Terriglobales bacterium]|nr:carboxypeptidase-like regulatory domain-containing protein [Terriglobales bacterium]
MFARTMKVFLLLLPLAFANLLYGQGGANGTIVGTVTDSSGAVIANAKVDVTNTATGVVVHTETGSTGDYTVPYLNPASYKISVAAAGFQKAESTPFTLVVGQQARVNISMKPGSATEVVEVTTSSVGLQTESPEISNTIAQKQIEELPLNGRNFVQLLTLGE